MRAIQVIFAITFISLSITTQAAVPSSLSYQGYLTDPAGSPIEGDVVVTFSIYLTDLGSAPAWSDAELITVDAGLFSVELGGPLSPFPAGLFDAPLWLGVTVDGDAEMLPRRPLTTVGFSFKADDASTLQGQAPATFDQSAHVTDTANPHGVTAAQVGAGREVVLSASAVDMSSFKSVTVQCPGGKVSIAGGGRMTFAPGSGSVGQAIANSYPNTETSWAVSAVSPNTPSAAWQLVAYAVCVSF